MSGGASALAFQQLGRLRLSQQWTATGAVACAHGPGRRALMCAARPAAGACRDVLFPLVLKSVRSLRSSVCKVRHPPDARGL